MENRNKTRGCGDIYVSQKGTVVTVIQTIGEYDHITRHEFETIDEANEYYDKF